MGKKVYSLGKKSTPRWEKRYTYLGKYAIILKYTYLVKKVYLIRTKGIPFWEIKNNNKVIL